MSRCGGRDADESLVWVDRKGHEEPIAAPLRAYGPPRLSPTGRAWRSPSPIGEHRHLDLGSRARNADAIDLLTPGSTELPAVDA